MLGPGPRFSLGLMNGRIDEKEKEIRWGGSSSRESTTSCSIISEHESKHASVAALFGHTFEGTPFFAARPFSEVTYAPLTSLKPSE